MKYITFIFIFLLCVFVMFGFKKDNVDISPASLNKTHICASDDMIIIHYNGPKAQIIWKDGSRSFYCEAREAFYESLDKIRSRTIQAFYVQDFSDLEWGSYIDKWVLASDAYYVVDSSKDGAMGLSYVPFIDLKCAEDFLAIYGGRLLKFNDINMDTLSISSDLLKDRMIF